MSGRHFLAWNMLQKATYEDERRIQSAFQAAMRNATLNPLEYLSDNNFVKEYRLSKGAFEDLCGVLRNHTELRSTQRVSLEQKVLCALLFYAHGSYQRITGKAHHFSQEAVSVYIQEVTTALNHPDILKRFIKFPKTREERDAIKHRFYQKHGIPGVIGCIDCSHFKIFSPNKKEEHLYYCRKQYYSMNVQMICDDNCLILSVNAKFGGATHDCFIWENSNVNDFMQCLHRNNEVVWLLGDSGYPQRPWIMTPYLNPRAHSVEGNFNMVQTRARVLIENTFGRMKNRWRCVHKDRTLHYSPEKSSQIIMACAVLHNIAINYNVPDPEEAMSEETQELFERQELVVENEGARELLIGRALREQLARQIALRRT